MELPAAWIGTNEVETPLGPIAAREPCLNMSGPCVAVLRPEQLSMVDPRPVGNAKVRGGPGTVSSVTYHGHDSLVHVRLVTGEDIAVRVPGESAVAIGESVRILVTGSANVFPA